MTIYESKSGTPAAIPYQRAIIVSCIGGFSTSITYGLPVQRQHDSLVQLAGQVFADMTASGAPGKYLVNIISSLRHLPEWMPGAGFKQAARELRLQMRQLMEEPYQATLKTLVGHQAKPNHA